jgi:glucose/arabinose dehydrogenase
MKQLRFLSLVGLVSGGLIACGDSGSTTGSGGDGTGAGSTTTTSASGGSGQGGGSTTTTTTTGSGGGGGGIGGFGPNYSCDAPTGTEPALKKTPIADLDRVVQIKSPPGSPDRVFIVRKNGIIRTYENGALNPGDFIDIGGNGLDLIRGGGTGGDEEGLLGLAFHPDYATNGKFYLHYSHKGDGRSTVQEFTVSADPLVANPTPGKIVLSEDTAQGNHNGGAVEFGNDGYLYISLGDGGEQGDPGCDAMNTTNLLGKIIRVDVDAACDPTTGCPAAPGNPDGAKYFHIAMRNPWRISFDYCTSDLYIGDVGQYTYEEIDVIPAAAGPQNLGWPVREGMHPHTSPGYDDSCTTVPATFLEPLWEISHGDGNCSVTGGVVYRGSAMPAYRGAYFWGDYCGGTIYQSRAVNGVATQAPVDTGVSVANLTAFGIDGQGEIYAADHTGTVYKIEQQ